MTPPYIRSLRVAPERVPDWDAYPFNLPFVRNLCIEFRSSVTYFVGENGAGKSTLLEGLTRALRLPSAGGGRNEIADKTGSDERAPLGPALRVAFASRPPDAYFLRAEHVAHFAELLDARREDPSFLGDPFARYGWKSLHDQSHGEAFLGILTNRITEGVILMDEPESALSPQSQLALLVRMHQLTSEGRTQFICATHSPILMTFPGSELLSFHGSTISPVKLEDTSHYRITRDILEHPEIYLQHLLG